MLKLAEGAERPDRPETVIHDIDDSIETVYSPTFRLEDYDQNGKFSRNGSSLRDITPNWEFLRDCHRRLGYDVTPELLRAKSPVWADNPYGFLRLLYPETLPSPDKPDFFVAVTTRVHAKCPILWYPKSLKENFEKHLALEKSEQGAWYLPNPISGESGTTKGGEPSIFSEDCIVRFDHAVLECDRAETEEHQALWLTWLCVQTEFPVRAIYTSGGKSIHALVKFPAASVDEWNAKMEPLKARLAHHGADPGILQPRRLTRLPWCLRRKVEKGKDGKVEKGPWTMQTLLYLNPNPTGGAIFPIEGPTFLELDCPPQKAQSGGTQTGNPAQGALDAPGAVWVPPPPPCEPEDILETLANPGVMEPEIVTGLFRRGEKVYLGGGSKSMKSWFLMNLALAVAAGREFLGRKTHQTPVLYVNLELVRAVISARWVAIVDNAANSAGISQGMLRTWNLRGAKVGLDALKVWLREELKKNPAGLVIIDPGFRLYRDRHENELSTATVVGEELEAIAAESGAAILVAMHFPKGDASGKDHIDRISGTGGFARDADSILTLTRHEDDDCFTFEATLRSLPPIEPGVVRWSFPRFVRESGKDPARLRKPGGQLTYTDEEICAPLKSGPKRYSDWLAQLDISNSTFKDRRAILVRRKKVIKKDDLYCLPEPELSLEGPVGR